MYVPTPEHRAKISASLMGHPPPNKGVPCSPGQRAKISATMKGRPGHRSGPTLPVGSRCPTRGYVTVKTLDGWKYEHRVLFEEVYGPVPYGFVVHHKNGIREDNRLENLTIMTKSQHAKKHYVKWMQRGEV